MTSFSLSCSHCFRGAAVVNFFITASCVTCMHMYFSLLLGKKLVCYVICQIYYRDNFFQGALIPEAASICKKCIAPKPPRTHHCSVCNKCILKMDHHCRILIMFICTSLYDAVTLC
jgi:Uncharacterized protein containing DHHC-type Zn finger